MSDSAVVSDAKALGEEHLAPEEVLKKLESLSRRTKSGSGWSSGAGAAAQISSRATSTGKPFAWLCWATGSAHATCL